MEHLLMLVILKLKEIAEKLGLIADYVVEQRTSGIWTYRKWNSGIAECWGRYVGANITTNIKWGALYYTSIDDIFFPITFIGLPIVTMQVENGYGWCVSYQPIETRTNHLYIVSPTNDTAILSISVHVKGRWK